MDFRTESYKKITETKQKIASGNIQVMDFRRVKAKVENICGLN